MTISSTALPQVVDASSWEEHEHSPMLDDEDTLPSVDRLVIASALRLKVTETRCHYRVYEVSRGGVLI